MPTILDQVPAQCCQLVISDYLSLVDTHVWIGWFSIDEVPFMHRFVFEHILPERISNLDEAHDTTWPSVSDCDMIINRGTGKSAVVGGPVPEA